MQGSRYFKGRNRWKARRHFGTNRQHLILGLEGFCRDQEQRIRERLEAVSARVAFARQDIWMGKGVPRG